ncbi:MAG: response regulator [Oscillospiraceae bacterium]|nr:response regulator [Oscillospiraceae bacterium]
MSSGASFEKKSKIVVVDDQVSVCREVTELLRREYDVAAFKSGEEVLAYLNSNTPDLIILDYYMPDMTGFETLLEIRSRKATAKTPAIFLTTELSDRMQLEMITRSASDYLTKPINAEALRTCVRKHLAANA